MSKSKHKNSAVLNDVVIFIFVASNSYFMQIYTCSRCGGKLSFEGTTAAARKRNLNSKDKLSDETAEKKRKLKSMQQSEFV